jgi:phytoene synthase
MGGSGYAQLAVTGEAPRRRALPSDEKLLLLARAWLELPWNRVADPGDRVLVALDDARRRFRLPVSAFDDLFDGIEADARGPVSYETFEDLVGYCRKVAGSIGRLVIAVVDSPDATVAASHADDLAVALQLTNILRDVFADRERGRVYLPQHDLWRFGCPPDPLAAPADAFTRLIHDLAATNREWYDRGRRLIPLLDPRAAAGIEVLTRVYERILDRIDQAPGAVLRGRIALTPVEKARIAASVAVASAGRAA